MSTVAGLTGISRIAGFVRDIMTASILGVGLVADAFVVALKLPNFFRRVTAEGAFSVSFVPVYTQTLEQDGKERAARFASDAFWIMTGILFVFSALAMLLMPFVIMLIAPGFQSDPERFGLAVELTRITFPYLLLMSLSALLGGILNANNRFAPFAFAPTLFNLSLIGALLLEHLFKTPGHALSWGILCAGFAQFFMLLYCAHRIGFRITFKIPVFTEKIRKVFRLMGPGVLGAGVMHINLFADIILASFLASGSISYLYYADRLNQLPLGVVGIAVGTALLPLLTKALSRNDRNEARHLFNRAMEYCLLLALPASLGLILIPQELIGALFERGAFGAEDTHMTAMVLMGYAIGLPPYILIKIFSTLHWANQDTTTPVKISIIATVFNIALSIALIFQIGVIGIALATGISGWLQIILHWRAVKGSDIAVFDQAFKRRILKIFIGTLLMGVAVFALKLILPSYIGNDLLLMLALVGAGITVYTGFSFFTGLLRLSVLKKIHKK